MKKKLLAFLLSSLMVASVAGCGKSESSDTAPASTQAAASVSETSAAPAATTASNDEAIADTVYIGYEVEHTSLNPHLTNNTTANQVYMQVYCKLYKISESGEVVFDALDGEDVSEDGLHWTLTLKKGLKFSDGSDLTMQDVYDTYRHALDNPASPAGEELFFMDNMTLVDDYTLKVDLDEPYAAFRNALSCNIGIIMSSDIVKNFSDDDINVNPDSFVFSGPYKITEWQRGTQLVLEANEYYFGEQPKTPKLVLYPIVEHSARGTALETGEINLALQIQAEQVAAFEKNDDIRVETWGTAGMRTFWFDHTNEIMADVRVRKALQYALDTEAICEALYPGMWKPCTSALPVGALGYKDLGVHTQDLEKAKELLAEAGYPDGFKTEIHTTSRYAKGVELAEAVAEQFKAINVDAEIVVWEWAAITDAWHGNTKGNLNMPIFIMGVGCDTLDADTTFNTRFTTPIVGADGVNNGSNYGWYSNEEVDRLVAEAAVELDINKRREAYERVCDILFWEDPSQLYIYEQVNAYGMDNNLHDFWVDPSGIYHFEDLYLTK